MVAQETHEEPLRNAPLWQVKCAVLVQVVDPVAHWEHIVPLRKYPETQDRATDAEEQVTQFALAEEQELQEPLLR